MPKQRLLKKLDKGEVARMAVDLVLASTASALALTASAAAAAADQDWQDEEFKLGGGKYESKAHHTQHKQQSQKILQS